MADKALANLVIKLSADNEKLRKDLAKAHKYTQDFASQIKKLGPMIAAAFGTTAIVSFASKSLQAYDEMIKNETLLRTALKGREDATQKLISQSRQLQKITLFEDDEIVKAQSLIAAFTKEEDQIKRIIPLVLDLATAKGMDLASAADLVSKTLGSSTNALKRYGVQVEGSVGSTERLESLVKGLSDAFEGQAEAAAKVGLGPLKQLQNQWDDLQESAGGLLAKGLLPLVGGLSKVINKVNELVAQPLSAKMEEERVKVNELAQSLFSTQLSYEDRVKILSELNRMAPEVVAGIDAENIAYDTLRQSLNAYNKEKMNEIILQIEAERVAKLKAKADESQKKSAEEMGYLIRKGNERILEYTKVNKELGDSAQKVWDDESKTWEEKAWLIDELGLAYDKVNVKAEDLGDKSKWVATDLWKSWNISFQSAKQYESAVSDVESATTSYEQLAAQLGIDLNKQGTVTKELTEEQKLLIDEYAAAGHAVTEYTEAVLKLAQVWKEGEPDPKPTKDLMQAYIESLPHIKALIDQRKELIKQFVKIDKNDLKSITNKYAEIKAIDELISKAKELAVVMSGLSKIKMSTEVQVTGGEAPVITPKPVTVPVQFEFPEELKDIDLKGVDFSELFTGIEIFDDVQTRLKAVSELAKVLGVDFDAAGIKSDILTGGIDAMQSELLDLAKDFEGNSEEIQLLIKLLDSFKSKLDEAGTKTKKFSDNFKDWDFSDWANEAVRGANMIGDVMDSVFRRQSNLAEQQLMDYENTIEKTKKSLADQLENGLITQEEYNKKMAKLESDLQKEKNKIQVQNAKNEQKLAIFRIIINTASAIAANLITPWMIPIIVALGAAQLSAVKSTPIPKFAKGGKVTKPTLATVGEKGREIGFYKHDVFDSQITKIIGEHATEDNPYIISPVQKLAAGGLVNRKTFAVIGDNLNAVNDPEVVTPLSKLTAIIAEQLELKLQDFKIELAPMLLPVQNNTVEKIDIPALENLTKLEVEVVGKITGDDIYLANKRAEVRQGRIR